MYPQISFPDLEYQLKLFDVVVDIVDIDVYVDVDVNVDGSVDVNVMGGPKWVFPIFFLAPSTKV